MLSVLLMLGLVYGCDDITNPFADFSKRAEKAEEAGDMVVAAHWWTKAAEQGDAQAQYNLGNKYADGEGVAEDDKQAVYWYTKAAEQGDADAQTVLAYMHIDGEGVPEDVVKAHMWLNIAAADNDDAKSIKRRIEQRMSPSQIEKAQEMARECVAKNYKGC